MFPMVDLHSQTSVVSLCFNTDKTYTQVVLEVLSYYDFLSFTWLLWHQATLLGRKCIETRMENVEKVRDTFGLLHYISDQQC